MNASLYLLLFRLGTRSTSPPEVAVWDSGYRLYLYDDLPVGLFLYDTLDGKLYLNDDFASKKLQQGIA